MTGKPVAGIPVQHSDELEKIIEEDGVSIGVIATPAASPSRSATGSWPPESPPS